MISDALISHVSRFTSHASRFLARHRRMFAILGCLLIFYTGTWWGRSVKVRRLTTLVKSYMDVRRHDVTVEIAPGIKHRQIKRGVLMNLLELSPDAATLRPYRALDAGLGTESLPSIARRHGALAAINGGYFEMSGNFRGESVGALKIDGEWISEPEQQRAAIGLTVTNGRIEAMIDRIGLRVEAVLSNGDTVRVDGLNRGRFEDELILFRPIFHPVTLTNADGVEVILRDHRVAQIRDEAGSSRIPPDGYVLSASGWKRDWVLAHVSVGAQICIHETVQPELLENQPRWQTAQQIIGGGPLLLRKGVSIPRKAHDAEGFERSFYGWMHPRAAIGVKADGTIILAIITAAVPKVRRGVTISRLTELMLAWGAKDALNLDGGGSAMMIVDGKVVNTHELSPRGEKTARGNRRLRSALPAVGRPVADALLIFRNTEYSDPSTSN